METRSWENTLEKERNNVFIDCENLSLSPLQNNCNHLLDQGLNVFFFKQTLKLKL